MVGLCDTVIILYTSLYVATYVYVWCVVTMYLLITRVHNICSIKNVHCSIFSVQTLCKAIMQLPSTSKGVDSFKAICGT